MATPTECINTTHDKAYDYKKSIQEDGTVKYYFIGNYGKYKSRFPNWTEAVDDGKWGTIRRNAIIEKVKFDCEAGEPTSPPNPSPPSSSQTSNIIENSEDPNANKLYGTVVDEKTLEPIKGANVQYGSLSDVTNDKGEFTIQLPTPEPIKPSAPPPDIPKECINTTHDRAYNYKRLTYRSGKVEYYFIGLYGKYKQNFPNWTLAPPDTLVGKTTGTINRDAIVERVKFDCPQATFPPLPTSSIDTPPIPTDIPFNPTSALRQIQGSVQFSNEDPLSGVYGNTIRLVKNEVGEITDPPYQTKTDFDGKFTLSIPVNSKFIQAKKSNSKQTIVLPVTQASNYVFDFTSITNDGIVQEQVETTVTRDRFDLEVSAIDYSSKSVPVIKGDGTLKNDLGIIPLKSTKAELIEEKLETIIITPEEVKEITKDKKDSKHLFKQKLLDLLKKLKTLLLPLILSMIAQFGITKLKELLDKGKDEIEGKFCPSPEKLDIIIKRKNQIVKQLNNSLKTIESATKILGISGNVILTLEIAFRILKNLPLPTSVPPGVGLPTNVLLGIQDNKQQIEKTITTLKGVNTSTLIVLNLLRQTIIKVIEYLNILDKLIQHCYQGGDDSNQEQISSELLALTQEQANQESPVVTIVNGFTMGVETEKTTNPLKRRRATATNAGGVVMLKGEWSFSSIDQILIDELVFYIQVNDLKAD